MEVWYLKGRAYNQDRDGDASKRKLGLACKHNVA